MELNVGTYIKVKTRFGFNKNENESPFGTCVWQIVETGFDCPESWRHKDGESPPQDGIKCVLIGGTGESARAGYTVFDSVMSVEKNIQEGITEIISESEAKRIEESLNMIKNGDFSGHCLELDV